MDDPEQELGQVLKDIKKRGTSWQVTENET
jgi:hypothetical protein